MAARTTHIAIHRYPWIKKELSAQICALSGNGKLGLCHVLGQWLEEFLRSFEQVRVVLCHRSHERNCEH
jgi:hypothetical protein